MFVTDPDLVRHPADADRIRAVLESPATRSSRLASVASDARPAAQPALQQIEAAIVIRRFSEPVAQSAHLRPRMLPAPLPDR